MAEDPKVARMLARLARQAEGSPYWVYLLRDPLTGDRRDWTTGDPYFVGQAADPLRAARHHLETASVPEAAPPDSHRARTQSILRQGRVPVFELAEPAATRLAALAAAARWAGRLRAQGFAIAGAPAEDAPFGDTGASLGQAWTLTLAEAAEAGVALAIGCPHCGCELDLPLEGLMRRSAPATRLAALRDALDCPGCGRGEVLQLVPPAPGPRG
jgi:hypothetical protein